MIAEQEKQEEMLEARYFQNDIVATAFEIFEKTNNYHDRADRYQGSRDIF